MSQDTRAEQAFGNEAKKNAPRKSRRPWSALENIIALANDDSVPAFRSDETTNWYETQREFWVRRVAKNRAIRPTTYKLASILSYYINRGRLDAWPGERELAEEAGMSRTTVQKAIKELKALGYLKVGSMPMSKGNHQPVNCYTFFLPSVDQVEFERCYEKTANKKAGGFQWVKLSTAVGHAELAVGHAELAVGHAEHGSGSRRWPITSNLTSDRTTDLTPDITIDKTTLRVVSHEREDRDDVKPDRPADQPDEHEVEDQPDQPDDASASCASAPGCSARSFTGWDVRPTDRSPREVPNGPPSEEILNVFVGLSEDQRTLIKNLQREH
jgi:hypothetical protein